MIARSMTAPIVASITARINPEPRLMPSRGKKPARDERTHDADGYIANQAGARPPDDFASKPARNKAD
jgi:hypothetical protein